MGIGQYAPPFELLSISEKVQRQSRKKSGEAGVSRVALRSVLHATSPSRHGSGSHVWCLLDASLDKFLEGRFEEVGTGRSVS